MSSSPARAKPTCSPAVTTLFLELQLDGDLLCFDGKLYGDWTVYMGSPEECYRPPDTFRQNTRPNDLRRQAKLKPWPDDE